MASSKLGEGASSPTLCLLRQPTAGGLSASGQDRRREAAGAILKLLVHAIRARFPQRRIVFRGDSGFCRRRILAWCERHGVGYIVGPAENARSKGLAEDLMASAMRPVPGTRTGG